MNPRTPISELSLSGSPNLRRALAREKADAEKPPLSAKQKTEIEKLDELIAQCMKCCKRGMTIKGKRNPAFANLDALTKVRQRILLNRDPQNEPSEIMSELDAALEKLRN